MTNPKWTILVADDDLGQLDLAADLLAGAGYRVVPVQNPLQVFERVLAEKPHLILLDVMMPHLNGFDLCKQLKQDSRTRPISVMFLTACYKDVKDKVFGLELGADDYIVKPYDIAELLARVKAILRVLELQEQVILEGVEKLRLKEEITELNQKLAEQSEPPALVAGAPRMRDLMTLVNTVAETDAHLLIMGETGTGKGLMAETIHRMGPRKGAQFVKVDCSVLTGSLLESELFGHEKGSFTGAVKTREGRFERAHGGTIFLDEVGELPLDLQVKLLRVVQDSEFERVGGDRTMRVDVRIIAATNVDLEKAVMEGRFRRDLYYRLNVIPIRLPALRERAEDIPPLAARFLEKYAARNRKSTKGISREAMSRLLDYHWPGNIRELEHVIERAVILANQDLLPPEAIMLDFGTPVPVATPPAEAVPASASPGGAPAPQAPGSLASLDDVQRAYIARVLDHTRGNKKQAAEILGISRNTLYEKLKVYGIASGTES